MSQWSDLIDRLTERLGVDPELRLDVAAELRSHLEDSAAEFREAHQSEQEAAASAAKALGDSEQLAEQLWQANRGRIRLRGVARWAARVALVPGAILVILVLLAGLAGALLQPLDASGEAGWMAELTEEQRFILRGDPAAKTVLEGAKSISDRWPDDPLYHAYYVSHLIDPFDRDDQREASEELLAALDKGERLDPENAFYNFARALVHIRGASTTSEHPSDTFEELDRRGRASRHPYQKIEIHDAERFGRGLAEFHRGLAKARCTGREIEMLALRLSLLPQADRLVRQLRRLDLIASCRFSTFTIPRDVGRALSAYVVHLAESGRGEQATEMAGSVIRMGAQYGAHGQALLELLIAQSITREAMAHRVRAYEILGDEKQANQARGEYKNQVALMNQVMDGPRPTSQRLIRSGVFWLMMAPRMARYKFDPEPMRSAEQFVAAELALLVMLAAVTLAALVLGGASVLGLLRRPKADRPILLFVGWRRIARICLLAIVAPLAAYAFYAYVLTAGDRQYGINYTFGKTLLELVLTIGVMCSLLASLGYSAVRRRAEELGLVVPPPLRLRDRKWIAGAAAVVALAAAVYLVGWWAGPFKPPPRIGRATLGMYNSPVGAFLAGGVGLVLLAWALREAVGLFLKKQYSRFRRTLQRSLVPVLAAAVIVVGLSCGWLLARGEASAARRLKGLGFFHVNEVERSDFRILRDHFAERLKATAPEAD